MLLFSQKRGTNTMIKSRELLEKKLTNKFRSNLRSRSQIREWIAYCNTFFKLPESISSDYIMLRKDLVEANEFLLFILCFVVYGKEGTKEFFTPSEIERYLDAEWYIEKAKFPLEFDMTLINDEQFIGKISVKELMKLKDSQLINYNENAQRTMKRIVRGEAEYYQISLNKDAVYSIMESFKSDIYIPNTITLNLPDDAVYYYDEVEKKLVIKKAEYLDILDGYHRYIAMSKVCTEYPDFDYEMELRVVQFTEDKARRFIWQEDQKTKMSRVDSESMDTAKLSNKIVERVNMSNCILAGQISRNGGIINAAQLSNAIDIVLLKGIGKTEERTALKKYSAEIINAIEYLTDKDQYAVNNPWPKKFIFMMVYEIKYGNIKDCEKDYMIIDKEKNIYATGMLTQADITRTRKILGKEK